MNSLYCLIPAGIFLFIATSIWACKSPSTTHWFKQALVTDFLIAFLLAGFFFAVTGSREDERQEQAEQLENQRFVRNVIIDTSLESLDDEKLREIRRFDSLDLKDVRLSGLDLRHSHFSLADLTNSEFMAANLACVDFAGANLSNANLRKANLKGARFYGTDLSGADLTGADLTHYVCTGNEYDKQSSLKYADLKYVKHSCPMLAKKEEETETKWPTGFKPPESAPCTN